MNAIEEKKTTAAAGDEEKEGSDDHTATNESQAFVYSAEHQHVFVSKREMEITILFKDVEKLHKLCQKQKKRKISIEDFFLGVSTFLLGITTNAWMAGVPLTNTVLSIFSYIFCLTVGCSLMVAYFFCRSHERMSIKQFAEKVEEHLPNLGARERAAFRAYNKK